MIDINAIDSHWFPIAASQDLPFRHVYHAQLAGRELALWRADDGNVNAWENRCLHRGVRLSIGINDGTELVCQYHGWRYANRTAGCTYIPAHPADAPARTICNNTYPVVERFGLVWSTNSLTADTVSITAFTHDSAVTPIRAVPMNASIEQTNDALKTYFTSNSAVGKAGKHIPTLSQPNAFTLIVCQKHSTFNQLVLLLQPLDSHRTVVRGFLDGVDKTTQSTLSLTELLKHLSHALNTCRDTLEAKVAHLPKPLPWIPIIPQISEANARLPERVNVANKTALRVQLTHIKEHAPSIKSFRFEPLSGILPTAQAGAHIDVHLPNGLTRQYSIVNGPGQTDHYTIAVKHLSNSTGGSVALHTSLKVGDVLAVSVPRNNFSLRRDAEHTILIAGGIGITPLLSMARAMLHTRTPFTLHYFVNSIDDVVFKEELKSMGSSVVLYTGLTIDQTRIQLIEILQKPQQYHHAYLCGPGPMLSLSREIATTEGWRDEAVHFEYFKNTTSLDTTATFTVELARSGLTLDVPSGQTLLSVLQEHHVAVPSSCEQGACGTCRVVVLDGEPDHQDVYLSDTDKAQGNCMMSCVSRAKSEKLVLDL